eukprot:1198580-Prymnesium_polylepis.1
MLSIAACTRAVSSAEAGSAATISIVGTSASVGSVGNGVAHCVGAIREAAVSRARDGRGQRAVIRVRHTGADGADDRSRSARRRRGRQERRLWRVWRYDGWREDERQARRIGGEVVAPDRAAGVTAGVAAHQRRATKTKCEILARDVCAGSERRIHRRTSIGAEVERQRRACTQPRSRKSCREQCGVQRRVGCAHIEVLARQAVIGRSAQPEPMHHNVEATAAGGCD